MADTTKIVKFVHVANASSFTTTLEGTHADDIVFIKDTLQIFTHGTYYTCTKADATWFESYSANDSTTGFKATKKGDNLVFKNGNGITITCSAEGVTIGHANTVAGGLGVTTDSSTTVDFGGTINVPKLTYDEYGHLTKVENTAVKLPAKPADTTYTAADGLKMDGTVIKHDVSTTAAGTAQGSATGNVSYGGSIDIPTVTYDKFGHVTGSGKTTVTLPAAYTSSVTNHYTPAANDASKFTGGTGKTITEITRDAKGHIVGITASDIVFPDQTKYAATFGTGASASATTTAAGKAIILAQNNTNKGGVTFADTSTVTVDGGTANTLKFNIPSDVALPGAPTTTTASAGTNDTKIATTAFVTTAVNNAIAGLNGALKYKGTIGTGGTKTAIPASTDAAVGDVYVAIAGCPDINGKKVEAGDMIICQSISGTSVTWNVVQANIDGAVTIDASKNGVAEHIAIFKDGTTIKDSGFTIATSVPANALFTDASTTLDGHYTPATTGGTAVSTSTGSAVAWSGAVVTGVTKDAKGHIIGVTTGTIPAQPANDNTTYELFTTAAKEGTTAAGGAFITLKSSAGTSKSVEIAAGSNVSLTTTEAGKIVINSSFTNTTYNVVSSSSDGLAPKLITNSSSIGEAYYILASSNGTAAPSWYKLPATAFSDTTYTFTNANATLAWNTSTKIATVGGTEVYVKLPENPNTHYTAKNIVGANASASTNASVAQATNAVYLNLIENDTVTSSHKISGGTGIQVSSDTSGNITIVNTQTIPTYTGESGITVTGTVIKHTNNVSAGTNIGGTANVEPKVGETFTVPHFSYDAQGHITAAGTHTVKVPAMTWIEYN